MKIIKTLCAVILFTLILVLVINQKTIYTKTSQQINLIKNDHHLYLMFFKVKTLLTARVTQKEIDGYKESCLAIGGIYMDVGNFLEVKCFYE